MRSVYYTVEHDSGEWHELELPGDAPLTRVEAQQCAEDYWNHHDGWPWTWPLTFGLSTKGDRPALVLFSVEMEAGPAFYAKEIQKEVTA